MAKRVGILTCGGDCPGLNALIRAIVRHGISMYNVECLGILRGWLGLLDGLSTPLDLESVSGILPRGGTILRTSRTNPFKLEDGASRIVENVERLGLSAVIVAGGDQALGIAHRLHSEHGLNVVGIPKTIDNDVLGTEYSFGFDSTVNIAMEAIDRIHTTAESHDRVMIVEVMGRLTGWIATCAGMASGADFILIPERPFSVQNICEAILCRHERGKDFSIVVVAEGARVARGPDQEPMHIVQDAAVDEFGQVRLGGVGTVLAREIESHTGYQTRVTILGHLQRGGAPSAFDRILGARFGVAAMDLVLQENYGKMVALQGNHIVPVPLEQVTQGLKTVPDEFYDVAQAFFG